MLTVRDMGNYYQVRDSRSNETVKGGEVIVHGYDTEISRNAIKVFGHENVWVADGQIHITDQKRGGPGDPFGLGDF